MRDQAVPEIHGTPHQEAAFPAIGERACPRPRQDEHPFPEWGHHSTTRGLGGLFGGPPRGLQPLCHPCEEGHNHAKRHSVGTPHQRGEELTALMGLTKNLVLFGTTTSSKRCIPMKAIPKYQKSIK